MIFSIFLLFSTGWSQFSSTLEHDSVTKSCCDMGEDFRRNFNHELSMQWWGRRWTSTVCDNGYVNQSALENSWNDYCRAVFSRCCMETQALLRSPVFEEEDTSRDDDSSCVRGYRFKKLTRLIRTIQASPCVDINECTEGLHDCDLETTTCINLSGSYVCDCKLGFMKMDDTCADIDECQEDPDNLCPPASKCVNTIGSYKCECSQGFQMSGNDCNDINECLNSTMCNSNTTKCLNTYGSFECQCLSGYQKSTSDENVCEDIDECKTGNYSCPPHSLCLNSIGSYICVGDVRYYHRQEETNTTCDSC